MNIFGKIPFLGESREKKTLININEHLETTYQATRELYSAFEALENGDLDLMKEKQKSVDLLEGKADKLRREIEQNLYSGAFLPISRSRILDFAENVDEIADAAHDASQLLTFLKEEKIPKELLVLFRTGIAKGLDSVELLKESIDNIENPDKVRELIKKIRLKEHESDEIGRQAYSFLYKEEHNARSLALLSKLIEFIGNISDKAEDASDSLFLIVLMHTA